MRIIVISDTHGNGAVLEKIVQKNKDADMFLHLGDGETEVDAVCKKYPDVAARFHSIKGNCDYGSSKPIFLVLEATPKHRIFATHGHRYGVHADTDFLFQIAHENGCDIALCGHTHISQTNYEGGMHIMNPGSAALPRDGRPPSYGFIDITDGGVFTSIVPLT